MAPSYHMDRYKALNTIKKNIKKTISIQNLHYGKKWLLSFGLLIPKSRRYIILAISLTVILSSFLFYAHVLKALTLYFSQTDWSGGADTNATIDANNATGWTKFYSQTGGIDTTTVGEIKLKLEVSQP